MSPWSLAAPLHVPRGGHAATLLADGRVLVTGGTVSGAHRGVGHIVDGAGRPFSVQTFQTASVELWDPASAAWTNVSPMAVPRVDHTAALLADGRVLVAGGGFEFIRAVGRGSRPIHDHVVHEGAELWDPQTGRWSPAGSLYGPRTRHFTIVLGDGRILVGGGHAVWPHSTAWKALDSAELFDPRTDRWAMIRRMDALRDLHALAALASGQVLAIGSFQSEPRREGGFMGSEHAETLDPGTGLWRKERPPHLPSRYCPSLTPLSDGRALLCGGSRTPARAELWDPEERAFRETADPRPVRYSHCALQLHDGQVLLIGGTATAPVEEWDPSTGLWKDAGSLAIPRHANASATLLQDGRVLVTGGLGDDRHVLAAVEVYAPRKKSVRRATVPARRLLSAFSTAGSWRKTGSLAVARFEHSATLLADGRVLVAGGVHRPDARHPGEALTSAEIWDPKSETWSATGDLAEHRRFHRAVLLPDGQVLLVGGFASAYYSRNTTEALIFNPSTATFAGAGRMTEARFDHTATVLPDGRVLVAGGKKGTEGRDHLATAEIWDRGNWTMAASLSASHAKHTALLLRNRDVLVLGGGTFVNIPGVGFRGAPAELWDTDTGTWRKVPDHRALQNITAAGALPDGRVLVVRSVDSDGRTSVEIGDPLSGTWRETDSLLNPKHEAIACFFPDGRLMLDEEIWDPVKEAWQSTPHMLHHRRSHTATALPDGRVLVTGGVGTGGADPANRTLSDCEVWEP